MTWTPWARRTNDDHEKSDTLKKSSPYPTLTDWSHWLSPNTVIPTVILTSTILISIRVYRYYLRRIPGASSISDSFWRKRSLFGKVTSIGDGDGLRLFHTPGGLLTGWGWLPGRKIPTGRALKDRTVCTVRSLSKHKFNMVKWSDTPLIQRFLYVSLVSTHPSLRTSADLRSLGDRKL